MGTRGSGFPKTGLGSLWRSLHQCLVGFSAGLLLAIDAVTTFLAHCELEQINTDFHSLIPGTRNQLSMKQKRVLHHCRSRQLSVFVIYYPPCLFTSNGKPALAALSQTIAAFPCLGHPASAVLACSSCHLGSTLSPLQLRESCTDDPPGPPWHAQCIRSTFNDWSAVCNCQPHVLG
jgi:hypothetical protein